MPTKVSRKKKGAGQGIRKTRSPLVFAPLENFGFVEGRVRGLYPRENKTNTPQAHLILEQRIPRRRSTESQAKVRYNKVLLNAFGDVATGLLSTVKVEDHLRVRFTLSSWKPKGRPEVLAANVEMFRIYRSLDTSERWMECDPLFDPPPSDCYSYDPEEDA